MLKIVKVLVICYVLMVVFLLIDNIEANQNKTQPHRAKRYLAFMNRSRFYLKFNFKNNMVPWNQLFAQALGFRMTWDVPPSNFEPYHRLNRRSIYNYVETLLDKNGLHGFHCVRRAICEVETVPESRNIYHRLLKIIFRKLSKSTERWHNTTEEECRKSMYTCPISLLDVISYTDIV